MRRRVELQLPAEDTECGVHCSYDIGATSGAIISITSQAHSGTSWYACICLSVCIFTRKMLSASKLQSEGTESARCRYDLSSFQSGTVVSGSLFGALGGSGLAFLVGDKLGRKRELLLAALLYGELCVAIGVAGDLAPHPCADKPLLAV